MQLKVDDDAAENFAQIIGCLRLARQEAGLSHKALAARLPVGSKALYEWEARTFHPTMSHLLSWTRELGYRLEIIGPDGVLRDGPSRRLADEPWETFELRRLAVPLRNRRLACRMTLPALGQLVGVSKESLRRWEHAHAAPRPIALIVWARKLEYTVTMGPSGGTQTARALP